MTNDLSQINQVELRYIRPKISTLPEISYASQAVKVLLNCIDYGKLD